VTAPGLALNHVGVTVPDIRAAIEWYGDVFGFRCIMGPRVLRANAAATAETASILGPSFRTAYQAHLMTAGGVGLELFQFVEPTVLPAQDGLGWERRGPWHLCFTHPDVEGQLKRVVEAGGEQVCPVSYFVPGRPWALVYVKDPWGTVLELMSHSYAEVFGNWPQPGMTQRTEWMPGGRLDAS
jgi:catechol 2,3-dioxygenase-like lactoylglutathione lyase family enzyme